MSNMENAYRVVLAYRLHAGDVRFRADIPFFVSVFIRSPGMLRKSRISYMIRMKNRKRKTAYGRE